MCYPPHHDRWVTEAQICGSTQEALDPQKRPELRAGEASQAKGMVQEVLQNTQAEAWWH